MAPDDSPALRLRAEDADDLAVLSACLQDALVAVARSRLSAATSSSFVSSPTAFAGRAGCARCRARSGHRARAVRGDLRRRSPAVSYRGFRRGDEDRILCLLAIRSEPDGRRRAGDPSRICRRRRDPARCRPHRCAAPRIWASRGRPHGGRDHDAGRGDVTARRRGDDRLIMALPNGRILERGDAAVAPHRHRARAGLRGPEFAPAAVCDQRSRSRHHPGAQLRRRDLCRVRRRPARRRRQRRADGVRLFRDLCAARPRYRALPDRGRGDRRLGRAPATTRALEPCPRRDQISRDHPPPFRRARRPGRVHQAQRRDRAGAEPRPVPPHRRSGADRRHACRPTGWSRSSTSPRSARA